MCVFACDAGRVLWGWPGECYSRSSAGGSLVLLSAAVDGLDGGSVAGDSGLVYGDRWRTGAGWFDGAWWAVSCREDGGRVAGSGAQGGWGVVGAAVRSDVGEPGCDDEDSAAELAQL